VRGRPATEADTQGGGSTEDGADDNVENSIVRGDATDRRGGSVATGQREGYRRLFEQASKLPRFGAGEDRDSA
jgi:hypothetical protein